MTSCKSDKSAKGASSLNFISAVKDKRVKHIKCTCINLNKQEKDNMVSCEKALISVVIELSDKEQERKKTFKQDLTCQKHGFWSLKKSYSNNMVCCSRSLELMPRWVSRVCSALYCSDCFMFPFPEPFLHCTVKTGGSILGLIVNRVKQDIEVWPLNPHWASSEWYTWLVELNGGRGIQSITVLTQWSKAAWSCGLRSLKCLSWK